MSETKEVLQSTVNNGQVTSPEYTECAPSRFKLPPQEQLSCSHSRVARKLRLIGCGCAGKPALKARQAQDRGRT